MLPPTETGTRTVKRIVTGTGTVTVTGIVRGTGTLHGRPRTAETIMPSTSESLSLQSAGPGSAKWHMENYIVTVAGERAACSSQRLLFQAERALDDIRHQVLLCGNMQSATMQVLYRHC